MFLPMHVSICCVDSLSEVVHAFHGLVETTDNLRIGSIDVLTNHDVSIFPFRLDEPIRQSRVR